MTGWLIIASAILGQSAPPAVPPVPDAPTPATASPAPIAPAPIRVAPAPVAPAPIAPAPESAPNPVSIRDILLRQYDLDGDGRLAPNELPKKFVKRFADLDANGDGYLDGDEILHDRGKLGRAARRAERLQLDRQGRLAQRGQPVADRPSQEQRDQRVQAALALAARLDLNADGWVDLSEVRTMVNDPEIAIAALARPTPVAPVGEGESLADPLAPGQGGGPLPAPTNAPTPTVPSPSVVPAKPASRRGAVHDGFPSADEILAALDRNHNGGVDRDEAVDVLADHFQRLDRDRNGRLDRDEIERGIKLAKMFGIKPKLDPRSYLPGGSSAPAPANSANPVQHTARKGGYL